jgi:predicted GNAT superfamily acetyltransferase
MEVRRIEASDIPALCPTIAKVIMDAPEAAHILKDIVDKQSFANAYVASQLKYWVKTGEIWVIGDNQGMLACHHSGKFKLLKTLYMLLTTVIFMMRAISKADRGTVTRNMRASAGVSNIKWRKQACKGKKYYFIDLIAIDPLLKGSGAFRKLIQPVLDRAKDENIPVLLDTHDKNNVPIYEHFGFEVAHQFAAKNDENLIQYAMIAR